MISLKCSNCIFFPRSYAKGDKLDRRDNKNITYILFYHHKYICHTYAINT